MLGEYRAHGGATRLGGARGGVRGRVRVRVRVTVRVRVRMGVRVGVRVRVRARVRVGGRGAARLVDVHKPHRPVRGLTWSGSGSRLG